MQNSRTCGQSSSFMKPKLHRSVIALAIAAVISGHSDRWRRLRLLGIVSLVFLAACGGGTSQSLDNPPPAPIPTITMISPNSAMAGGAAFMLTINGTNFVAASYVDFGEAAPTTTFVNSTQLTAAIPASSIASTGVLEVTVTNPAPGGGTSNAKIVTITSGGPGTVPTINSFYPSCAPAGEQFVDSVDNQLVVSGLNFGPSSVVRWNGADRPTTFDNNSLGTILTAQISASDIAAPGTAAVTVFSPAPGGGSSNSLTFTITTGGVDPLSIAVDSAGKFAYVANAGCNGGVVGYVSMYTVNPTTGALASIGPPVSSRDYSAESVTVDPSGKFAYVANSGDDFSSDGSVVMYTIDATTGALTFTGAISGNCPGLCVPLPVVVGPSGKFAYVANGDGLVPNSVAMYTINATTGALTSIGATSVEGFASSVAVDPTGKFAYVTTDFNSSGPAGDVSMYTVDATTGALASIGTIAAGTNPGSVTVDPVGKFAYAIDFGSNDVLMFSINGTTGALASIGTIAAGTNAGSMAMDPLGKFAYVTNFGSNDVSMYTINVTTGALTLIGTIAAGQSPTSIAIHPSGKFAYVTNSGSNDVSMYSIDAATGALTLTGTVGT